MIPIFFDYFIWMTALIVSLPNSILIEVMINHKIQHYYLFEFTMIFSLLSYLCWQHLIIAIH